jgi:hypothetical protein
MNDIIELLREAANKPYIYIDRSLLLWAAETIERQRRLLEEIRKQRSVLMPAGDRENGD